MLATELLRRLQRRLLSPRAQNAWNARRQAPIRHRVRPGLEVLEDRTVPTVLDVNTHNVFSTIQAAVNAANPDDTLQVGAGVYQENVVINKSLTLEGPNAGINPNTGTRGPEAIVEPASGPNSSAFLVEANNVMIDGLTIDGQNNAAAGITNVATIPSLSNTTVVSGLTVKNDIIQNLTYAGIMGVDGATASAGNVFSNNKIDNIPATAVSGMLDENGFGILVGENFYAAITSNSLTGVGTGIKSYNNNLANPDPTTNPAVIADNTVAFNFRGIFVNGQSQNASPLSITANNLTYLWLAATAAGYNDGLFVASVQDSASVTIQNNNVSGAQFGIELWNDPTTSSITVQGGTLTQNQIGVWATNNDVYYGAGANTTAIVDGMTITGPGGDGVLIQSDAGTNSIGLTVRNSTMVRNGNGVEVVGLHPTFVLTNDGIFGNSTGVELDIAATSDDHINGCAISGNHSLIIRYPTYVGLDFAGSGTLDATNDWWGSPTGPTNPANPSGVGQAIVDSPPDTIVNFMPFLTTSPLPAATTAQLTSVSIAPNLLAGTAQVTLTAQVSSVGGSVNGGSMTFTFAGHSVQGSVVNGMASAELTVSLLSAGRWW